LGDYVVDSPTQVGVRFPYNKSVLKKIGRGLAYVMLFGGIGGGLVRSLLGQSRLQHGAMDAAPFVPIGLGALILAAVGENFTWRNGAPAPLWLGRLAFGLGGCWFLFAAWGIWRQ